MKHERREIFFNLLLIPVDALALFFAGALTWYLRFQTDIPGLDPSGVAFDFQSFLLAMLWIVPLYLIILAIARLYADHRELRFLDELFRVALAIATGTLALIVILFLRQESETSRFLILAAWILGTLIVGLGRFLIRIIERWQLRRGIGVHNVVIIGDNEQSRRLRKNFRAHPEQGVRVVGLIATKETAQILRSLENYMTAHGAAEIIQTDQDLSKETTEKILDFADINKLRYKFTPNTYETQATNIGISTVAGMPIVELKATPLEGWGRVGKRTLDIFGASAGLVVLSPVFLFTAIAIKLDSVGPVFEKMARVGASGEFLLFKFRSMIKDARFMKEKLMKYNERTGPLFKMKQDPRITRVGRFIRRTSIDELAQLINVLKGEMSLVGPRPHEPNEVAKYQQHHYKLLRIKPGITGLAAISGRSDLDFEEEVRLDTYYIEHWTLLFDLKILIRTLPAVLARKAAV